MRGGVIIEINWQQKINNLKQFYFYKNFVREIFQNLPPFIILRNLITFHLMKTISLILIDMKTKMTTLMKKSLRNQLETNIDKYAWCGFQ